MLVSTLASAYAFVLMIDEVVDWFMPGMIHARIDPYSHAFMSVSVKEGPPIKAAIVDDLAAERQQLCSLLKQYEATALKEASLDVADSKIAAQQPPLLHVSEFDSGSALLREYTPGTFDVIFMDIFMNDETGVDCALQLRQIDPHVNLVFLTTSAEFGVKSYDVRAADYIVKPATME